MTGHSRGLAAVTRVREVLERDSKLGARKSAQSVLDRVDELQLRQQALDDVAQFTVGSGADLHGLRQGLATSASAVNESAAQLESGRVTAAEALSRWQQDRSRLRAVELLAARRDARLREELRRSEARDLDDVAGRNWLRDKSRREPS